MKTKLSALLFLLLLPLSGAQLACDEAEAGHGFRRRHDRAYQVEPNDAGVDAGTSDAGLDAGYANVQAVTLDGVNERITLGDIATGLEATVTWSAWQKQSSFGSQECVFCKYTNSQAEFDLATGSNGTVVFRLGTAATVWTTWTSANNVLTANTWHHLCVTYASSAVTVYVDGVDITGGGSLSGSWPAIVRNTSGNARIGASTSDGAHFSGLVDEVAIWISSAPTCSDIYFSRVLRPLDGFTPAADNCYNLNAADNTTVPDSCGAITGTPNNLEAGDFSGADMPP